MSDFNIPAKSLQDHDVVAGARFTEYLVAAHAAVLKRYQAIRHAYADDIASDAQRRTYQAACKGSSILSGTEQDVRRYMFRAAKSAEAEIYKRNAGNGSQAPKGWYPDPDDLTGSVERWWDGGGWTDTVRDWAGERVAPPAKWLRPQCTLPGSIEGYGWSERDADDSYFEPGVDGDEAFVDLSIDLESALSELSEPRRLAVVREMEGYTYKELAEEIGIKANTANSHRVRGLAAVREQLGDTYR